MIALHTWKAPNGRKVPILLEEPGLPRRDAPAQAAYSRRLRQPVRCAG